MQACDNLIFQITDILRFQRNDRHIRTRNKSCCVIVCRISGESLFYFNNETHVVRRGDVLLIPPGSSYSQTCEHEELVCFHLNVYGNMSAAMQLCTPEDPDEMCALFLHACSMWQNRRRGYLYHCMSDLYKILALTTIDTTPDGPIAASLQYLHAHLYENSLSLETVCEASNLSKTSFIKHFRALYGCTPMQYIHRMRMERAKSLLKNALFTREEVAALCGYSDVKYFYVLFKKMTGMTTGEYLKKT